MTLRTITSPYDPQTLTELQTLIANYKGVAWANFTSNQQTVYQRFIDSGYDYLVKRFGNTEWFQHEESLSMAASVSTLSLSAAARHPIVIIETYDGTTRTVQPTTKREAFLRWGNGSETDPWNNQLVPYWYVDGMTDDNPPQIQMKRVPTPDRAITGTALVRPYLTLIGSSGDQTYTHMPANAATALQDYILARVDKHDQRFNEAAVHKQFMEDEIAAIQVNDNPEGGWETSRTVGEPAWVDQEMEP